MTTQQDNVDVERLRAVIHNDVILFGQIEQRMRECWIGTGKLCEDGSASNDFRVWMNEAHNRQRDLKAALGQNPSLPLAALSLPITQRNEQAKTYDDAVEDAAKVCDAYVDVNFEQAGDSVLLDPCLRGKGCTPENVAASERLQIDGLVHSSQAHAGQHLATAIRRLSIEQGDKDGGAE